MLFKGHNGRDMMRIVSIVGLSVAISLVMLFGCGGNVRNLDSTGANIICFGDSITAGVGAEEKNYPEYLSELIGRDVVNAGVEGDTTKSALMRVEDDVVTQGPRLVIVELGGNDYLQNVPRGQTLENLERIVERIQKAGAVVALCDVSSGLILSGHRNDLKKLAARSGCIFIPGIMRGVLEDPTLKYDEIHPNSKGYKIIAERVYAAINKYIR